MLLQRRYLALVLAIPVTVLVASQLWRAHQTRLDEAHRTNLVAALDEATWLAQQVVQFPRRGLDERQSAEIVTLAEALQTTEARIRAHQGGGPTQDELASTALRYIEACRQAALASAVGEPGNGGAENVYALMDRLGLSDTSRPPPAGARDEFLRLRIEAIRSSIRETDAEIAAWHETSRANDAVRARFPTAEFLDPLKIETIIATLHGHRATRERDLDRFLLLHQRKRMAVRR